MTRVINRKVADLGHKCYSLWITFCDINHKIKTKKILHYRLAGLGAFFDKPIVREAFMCQYNTHIQTPFKRKGLKDDE